MEINGKPPFVAIDAYVKNVKDRDFQKTGTPKDQGAGAGEDHVVLSEKAREIQELKRTLNEVPEVREEKVAEIRKRIQEGTYQPDGEKIAARMIRDSLLNELSG